MDSRTTVCVLQLMQTMFSEIPLKTNLSV